MSNFHFAPDSASQTSTEVQGERTVKFLKDTLPAYTRFYGILKTVEIFRDLAGIQGKIQRLIRLLSGQVKDKTDGGLFISGFLLNGTCSTR